MPPFYYLAGGFFHYISFTIHTYIHEKRESHLSFTLLEGFAIPVTSRKTTEIHARYVQPARPISERG